MKIYICHNQLLIKNVFTVGIRKPDIQIQDSSENRTFLEVGSYHSKTEHVLFSGVFRVNTKL